jgi:epoxyqueuosine reductase QueG
MALPLPCDSPYEYWEEANSLGKGLISMKHAAVLCGIGTMGKNTLLLNRKYGNLLTIGAILTDLELASDAFCDTICIEGCTKCLDACPVNAIENGMVNQKRCRTNTYGKTARGFATVDCNICRVVCPMRFGRI